MQGGQPPCMDIHRNTPCPQGHPTAGLQLGLSAACSALRGPHPQGPGPAGAVQSWGLACWGGSQLGSPQAQRGSEEEQSTEMQLLHRFIV